MKKTLISIIATIFACLTMSAQVAPSSNGLEYNGGKYYRNGVELTTSQLCDILGEQSYGSDYVPARNLRTAGITCIAVGGSVALLGSGLAIFSSVMTDNNKAAALKGEVPMRAGIISASCGAAVAVAGALMLADANKRLKNLAPASSGAGLALAF